MPLKAKAKNLVSAPVLFILQQVWRLDAATVEHAFTLGGDHPRQDRKDIVMKMVNYIRKYDPSFTWKTLVEIEGRAITNEEGRVMFSLQDSMNEMMEKGIKKGREEGRQEGREEGRQEGRQEGREEGRQEGEEKGRLEERRRLALSMLKDDFNFEVIEKHTGLSRREIEALSKD